MIVERLELIDFRNYSPAVFDLTSGVTAVVGKQRPGKTYFPRGGPYLPPPCSLPWAPPHPGRPPGRRGRRPACDVPWDRHPGAKLWYARIKSRPSFRPLLQDRLPGLKPAPQYDDLDF